MSHDPGLIDRPARLAVRLVALGFLAEADSARRSLLEGGDPEALHDLRVALRRLRSCLRTCAPLLEESVRRRDRRRLRMLAQVTAAPRDLEVQLARLADLPDLSPAEAIGVDWLVRRRTAAKAEADERMRRVVADAFPPLRARLERRLSRYEVMLDPANPDSSPPTFGLAAAPLITVLGAQLEARLAGIREERDQDASHDARITGKRLRYALEPLRAGLPAAVLLIDRLKALQDLLGDMHDADVLCRDLGTLLARAPDPDDEPPEESLRALHDRFCADRARLFERVRAEWLGTDAAPFFEAVHRAARELRTRGEGGVEIERKYLLDGMPRMGRKHVRRLRIDQGWLPGQRLQERLRRVRSAEGTRWFRTVKIGRGVRRTELEEETTQDVFRRLWHLTRGRRVHKIRHVREHDGLIWEIDRFVDRDLVLAEVELPAADTPITFPAWLEPHIVREVTGEAGYVNVNLAK